MEALILEHVFKRFRRSPMLSHTTLKDFLVRRQFFKRENPGQHIEALKDITFSVPEGMVLGIIGPNGSGKSTLLKLLARIYRPTSGRISIHGRVAALLNLGYSFHPELSGRENVVIGLLAMGITRHQIRYIFDEVVDFAEAREFIDVPVRTYSSGMFMRLAFSVAVSVNPDILLIDEILSVGDAHFAKKSKARIDEFKKQGKTILLVTHDLSVAENWCNQVLWLDSGNVRALGEPKQVIESYRRTE